MEQLPDIVAELWRTGEEGDAASGPSCLSIDNRGGRDPLRGSIWVPEALSRTATPCSDLTMLLVVPSGRPLALPLWGIDESLLIFLHWGKEP